MIHAFRLLSIDYDINTHTRDVEAPPKVKGYSFADYLQ